MVAHSKTLLISLMILPVSQALAVPKVVGNGFSENMTIGQSEDTLGSVRDKANAAMPKEGGTFTGGIEAELGNFRLSVSTKNLTASHFYSDSDEFNLSNGDLESLAVFSTKKITFHGDKLSLYPSDPAATFPSFTLDANSNFLTAQKVRAFSLYVGEIIPEGEGIITAGRLMSKNGLLLDKGDVRIGTRGNLILTTAENAIAAYLSSDTSGDLLINTGIAGGGGIRPAASTFDSLTKSPTTGSIHICSDCMINGRRFVAVMWNGSAWTGLSGEEVTH